MFSIRSLRAKTILSALVPTALVLVVVAIIALYAYERVARDLVQQRDIELARVSAARLSEALSRYWRVLRDTATEDDVQSMRPTRLRSALEKAQHQLYIFDAGVVVYNSEGVAIWSQPFAIERLSTDFPLPSAFDKIRQTLQPVFSDIFKEAISGEDVVLVGVPIVGGGGEFKGVLVGMFKMKYPLLGAIYADVLQLKVGRSGYAYLVDGNGQVIYHPDGSQVGRNLAATLPVMRVTRGESGVVFTEDSTGESIISGFAPVPGTDWGLITHERWKEVVGLIQGYNELLLGLLVVGGIISGGLIYFAIGRILQPIRDLTQGARRIAEGDFDYTIAAKTGDEIQALAQQFNTMASALKASYTDLERRVADRTEELAALNAIAATVSQSLDLEEILNDALDKTLQVIEIEAGGIYLLDEEAGVLTVAVHRGFSSEFVAEIDRLKVGEGFSGRVVQSGQPLLVRDVSTDPRLTRMVAREEGLHSLAIAPLSSKGKVLGTLFAITRGYREFSDQDAQLLTSIGLQIGVAIENARLFEAESKRRQEATLLAEMAKLISGTLDLNEVLRLTAKYAVDVLDVHCCCIFLRNEGKGTLRPATHIGFDDPVAATVAGVEFTPSDKMRRRVFEDLQPLIIEDVPSDPHLSPQDLLNLQSALVVPIEVGGRRLGAMQLGTRRPKRRRFTADEGELALAMANQAAVAIENARLFKAQQRRAEQFRVISEVGRRITSILAVDELLDQMAKLIKEAFNYYHVSFGLIEGDELVTKAGAGPLWDAYQSLRLKVGQEGIGGWVAQSGEPLLVPDVSQEPRYYFVPQAAGTRSELCVPLKTKEAVIGVLDVQSDQLNAFDESDLAVLQSLANQAAVAIESARLFRDATRQVRELRALADASRIISSVLDQDQLLQALYEQITRIAPTDFYLIALYDEATNVVSIEIDVDEGVHYPKDQYVLDKGLLKLVIHNRQPLRFDSLADEKAGLGVEIVPAGSGKANQGWLGVPMLYGDKVLGAIVVGSYQRGTFDEGHQQTLTSIANQAAVALENARLYKQAQQVAVMEERSRLARELHDAVTQTLFSASLIAEALPVLWESNRDEGRRLLKQLRQLSRGALAEMRTLLMELRPAALVEAGLGDLLRHLAEAVAGRKDVSVAVTVEDQCELPSDVHVALYRIAQEALNNVVKHAQASQVAVSLRCASSLPAGTGGERRKRVELRVSDDGRGFDPSSVPLDRLGLSIMRERAQAVGAALNIESQPRHGTQVVVVWEG